MTFEETAEELAANVALARLRPRRAGRGRRRSRSTTSASSAARSRRPANTTSKACSSASATRSTRSAPSGSCSTPSRRCSPASPTRPILRAELRRLFRWLKDRGVTAVITGERGDGRAHPPRPRGIRLRLRDPARPPRQRAGLDPAAAHRQVPRLGARHQRVPVPDRRATGSRSCRSPRCASTTRRRRERVSTGVAGLDADARRQGLYPRQQRAGLGHARHRQEQPRRAASPTPPARAASACLFSPSRSRRRRSCATCARSASTSTRWVEKGLLRIHASRPTLHGLELHLVAMYDAVRDVRAARWSSSIRSAT